jgi:histidinol-phosphate aminotransferase
MNKPRIKLERPLRVKPNSLEHIWVPTEFSTVDQAHNHESNLCGCENSRVSEKVLALAGTTLFQPDIYLNHWTAQDPKLREMLAELHGVSTEQILLTSGALSAIWYCHEVFVNSSVRVGLLRPDFPGFVHFAKRHRANLAWLEKLDFPFTFAIQEIIEFVKNAEVDFFIFSNPSAVTGTIHSNEEIEDLVSASDALIVNDEADIMASDSTGYLTNIYPNLIVLRSFSKFYGLAGMRVGYIICPREMAGHFQNMINPLEITPIGIMAAKAVLEDEEYARTTKNAVNENKAKLERFLKNTSYQLAPGSACFAAYLWGDPSVEDPYKLLLKKEITILKGANFGLSRGGRINLTSSAKIDRLIAAIPQSNNPSLTLAS